MRPEANEGMNETFNKRYINSGQNSHALMRSASRLYDEIKLVK